MIEGIVIRVKIGPECLIRRRRLVVKRGESVIHPKERKVNGEAYEEKEKEEREKETVKKRGGKIESDKRGEDEW